MLQSPHTHTHTYTPIVKFKALFTNQPRQHSPSCPDFIPTLTSNHFPCLSSTFLSNFCGWQLKICSCVLSVYDWGMTGGNCIIQSRSPSWSLCTTFLSDTMNLSHDDSWNLLHICSAFAQIPLYKMIPPTFP